MVTTAPKLREAVDYLWDQVKAAQQAAETLAALACAGDRAVLAAVASNLADASGLVAGASIKMDSYQFEGERDD